MNFLARIQSLQKLLNSETLLVEKGIDIFYLTGLQLSAGSLVIQKEEAFLLVDGRYYEMCRQSAPIPVFSLGEKSLNGTVLFDAQTTSYARYCELHSQGLKLQASEAPVARLRMIKEPEEIALLKEAAHLGSAGYDFVCSQIREGVTEQELALQLEIFWKQKGSRGVAFEPIIAFGSHSAMPHYRNGNFPLTKGMNVLIDIGVNLNHYLSDMTRVLFFGEPDPEIKKIYAIVAEAQKRALSLCRPGTLIGDLDKAARELITEAGYGPFFSHNLGHGVGLEIHELPSVKQKIPFTQMPLEEGMVITIEPGIYLPTRGGVRLEDCILITNSGYENLTKRPI